MTIKIGQYFWRAGQPIPECDSCEKNNAEYKVYVPDKIGIRLCNNCLAMLFELKPEGLKKEMK